MHSTESPLHSLSPQQYTLRMELAKQEALRLRREAIAALWHSLARALRGALKRGRSVVATPAREASPCPR
jgi:hypothetical protein